MDPSASAPVSAAEYAVRPVEATADPASQTVDELFSDTKAESSSSPRTCQVKEGAETSAREGDNQRQEPVHTCNATHGLAPESTTVEPLGAPSWPSDTLPDAVSSEESPMQAEPEALAQAEAATASVDSTVDELITGAIVDHVDHSTAHVTAAKPAKKEKKARRATDRGDDSFLPDETLALVQQFLTDKVALSQCSSHSRDVLEFVGQHMNDKQRRRYVGPLVQRIVEQLAAEARARGEEDVSVDVQTSVCLVEQMFLTLGRQSPLQDMYTQEEEEMLDLLFHGDSEGSSAE